MIGVSTSQEATKNGTKVTQTVAAIVIDKDYKIVSCRIDALEIETGVDENGKITIILKENLNEPKSKVELGNEYGMLTNSPYYGSMLAEWDDQVKAFEKYVEGKTRDEIKAIPGEDGKATDKTLTAGCTIAVSDFIKAIDKAFASKQMVGLQTKGKITLGVSVIGKASNKDAATASYTADFGAVAIVDGKILAATLDSKEVTCKYDTDGNFNKISDKGTKNEQGDNYGMVAYGDAIAEWYEQAQAFLIELSSELMYFITKSGQKGKKK